MNKNNEKFYGALKNKDLFYGRATILWNESARAWAAIGGGLIYSRREAGAYVERLHKLIAAA